MLVRCWAASIIVPSPACEVANLGGNLSRAPRSRATAASVAGLRRLATLAWQPGSIALHACRACDKRRILRASCAGGFGHVAEWLRSGLQIRAPRFDSGRGLHYSASRHPRVFQPFSKNVRCTTLAVRASGREWIKTQVPRLARGRQAARGICFQSDLQAPGGVSALRPHGRLSKRCLATGEDRVRRCSPRRECWRPSKPGRHLRERAPRHSA